LYILEFDNLHDNDAVDEVIEQHRAYLLKYVDAGIFLVAGAKVPRDGGIVVVANIPRAEVEAIVAEAPLAKLGLARIRITEFKSVRVGRGVPVDPPQPRR
jgi:uncharacterized protein YciI